MSERAMQLTDLFVRKANKHRIEELQHELEEIDWGEELQAIQRKETSGSANLSGSLCEEVQEARHCALDLLTQLRDFEPEDFNGSLSPVTSSAEELTERMDQVENATEGELEDLETWRILSSVVVEVAEPHLRNLFLFQCATLMARADGELSSVESAFLHSLAEKIGLPAGETQDIIREGAGIDVSHFHGDPEDAFKTIHQLYLCALADGVVQGSEKRMLHRVASSLGVPDSKVHEILYGDETQGDVDDLDKIALEEYLFSFSDLPENVFRSHDLKSEKIQALRDALGIPSDEQTFLIYENCFLEERLECSALTGRNLWVSPPNSSARAIRVSNIADWHFGMRSTLIRLDDETEIRFSRDARQYLKLVKECLKQALSAI